MAETNNKKGAPEVMETLNKNEAFIVKYKKIIIAGVVLLFVIVAGVLSFKSCQSKKMDEASTKLAAVQAQFDEVVPAESMMADSLLQQQYQQMLNGDSKTAVAGFLKISNDYSSTKAANLANLYAGLCYADMGQWKEAAQYLEKFDGKDDAMVSPAAKGALGNAYANLGQLDKAVETLKDAAEKADNMTVSPGLYIQAGEILESQNKNADALKMYEAAKKYIDLMPAEVQQGMQRMNIDAYIERVNLK